MKDLIRMSVLGIGLLLVAAGCAHTMPAGTTTTTLPSSSGQPVVMTSPAQPGTAPVGGGLVRHNFTGEITDVDRNRGKVDRARLADPFSTHGANRSRSRAAGRSDTRAGCPRTPRRPDAGPRPCRPRYAA